MKTFAIMTLGCKVNDYESAYVKNKLSEEYEMVDFKEKSDIYIIFSWAGILNCLQYFSVILFLSM